MNETVTDIWAFGGPLAGAPPATAGTILAAALGLCALFGWVSYRHSVARLGFLPSVLLMLLRATTVAVLLGCLANPMRIERRTGRPPEPPPPPAPPRLTVVVDRSDSMTVPDNRGRSRLDEALVTWRRLEKTTQTYFGPTHYFSLAEDLRPAATLEEALARQGGTGETRLHRSLATLLKNPAGERPDAMIVLTDGVDTTTDPDSLVREAALAAGVPVYFVAGTNRSARPDPFLRVREWRVPSTAVRRSEFALEATFEAFSRADRTVPFSLWQAGRRIVRGELALTTGPNLISRSFSVAVGEPGPVEFTLRIGVGDEAPVAARALTHVLDPQQQKIRVLVHQSTLDWGLRYFSAALRTDPSFEFFTIMTPDVGLTLAKGPASSGAMIGRLPDTVAPYAQFDCVVLVHPYPKRLATTQQQALVDFVRDGGKVLFLSPDEEAMPQFANGPLKELLPVFVDLDGAAARASEPAREPGLREVAARLRDPRSGQSAAPTAKLGSLALTDAGRASPIFARADGKDGGFLLPRFVEYVSLRRAKPGAAVLAVHPTARDGASGNPLILLATQTFGLGRSAILASDSLWRWKLDEPSESRAVETFWQQLLLAIGRKRETASLRFANAPAQVRLGQPVTLRIGGVKSDKLPVVLATDAGGRRLALDVKLTPEAEAPWSVEWTPDRAGSWEVLAGLDGAYRASIFPSVTIEAAGELARTVPALDAMRALAGETGGALLTQEPPAAWRTETRKEKAPETVVSERKLPRWNTWSLLALALGIYAVELGLRRRWKLL